MSQRRPAFVKVLILERIRLPCPAPPRPVSVFRDREASLGDVHFTWGLILIVSVLKTAAFPGNAAVYLLFGSEVLSAKLRTLNLLP